MYRQPLRRTASRTGDAARAATSSRPFYSAFSGIVPIFFAGIVSAAAFRDSRQPDVDFGSNIGGAVLGGLTEPLSLFVGFRYLLVIALGCYGLSALLNRTRSSS